MFEPFHPVKVSEAKNFSENMYLHPDEENSELHSFMQKIFEGAITNSWVDQELKKSKIFRSINQRCFCQFTC